MRGIFILEVNKNIQSRCCMTLTKIMLRKVECFFAQNIIFLIVFF